jgi:hypothetical protein
VVGENSFPLGKRLQWFGVLLVCLLFFSGSFIQRGMAQSTSEPVFDYVSVSSRVHLIDEQVRFTCVSSSFSIMDDVTVHLIIPSGDSISLRMVQIETGKFVNISQLNVVGSYSFFISALVHNQTITSRTRSFWITNSLSDVDNDKMDDGWEQFYGLNPRDPSDAYHDFDNDGFKNLDEFTMRTDPLDANYFEFMRFHILSHAELILLTISLLFCSLLFSLVGLRRLTKWI